MKVHTPLGYRELPDEILKLPWIYCSPEDLHKPLIEETEKYTAEWKEVNGQAVTVIRLKK